MTETINTWRVLLQRIAQAGSLLLFVGGFCMALKATQEHYYARESEMAVRSLIEGSKTAVITMNAAGINTDWPEPAEKMLGYTADEMIGSTLERLMPPDKWQIHKAGFDSIMGDPKLWDKTIRVYCTAITKSGKAVKVVVTTRVTPSEDGPLAIATIDRQKNVVDVNESI